MVCFRMSWYIYVSKTKFLLPYWRFRCCDSTTNLLPTFGYVHSVNYPLSKLNMKLEMIRLKWDISLVSCLSTTQTSCT